MTASAGVSKWYPADDVKEPRKSRRTIHRAAKLRKTISPGTVLILLGGRFRGKRVVFLKQLPKSGLLLVTGPYKINGVPLRRVNQAYVIATSTKVDLSGVKLPGIDDSYFKRSKTNSSTEEESFFSEKPKPAIVSDQRKGDQKAIDASLVQAIAKVPLLKEYLNAKFSLSRGDRVHNMKF
eukprot:447949_1